MQISPVRRLLSQFDIPVFFPYGKTSSRNVIADYNSRPEQKYIEVLLLNCGDLQKALQTASSQQAYQMFQFNINESHVENVARNILILKIISSPNFDPSVAKDMEYLWSVWYDVCWSVSVTTRFQKDVQKFITEKLPGNIKFLHGNSCLHSIKKVWKDWASIVNSFFMDSSKAAEIFHERYKYIIDGWKSQSNNQEAWRKEDEEKSIKVELLCHVMKNMGVENISDELGNHVVHEIFNFFSITNQSTSKGLYVNPTLLELTTHRWFVHHTVCPFNGFLPLPVNEMKPNPHTVSHYCRKVLMQHVTAYALKGERIRWTFSWRDSLELCYTISEKFDVIFCSELADNFGLANILNAAGRRLNEKPESIILVETSNWSSLAPTPDLYVQEALCAPISMLPSIYGLRLAESINFGASSQPYPSTLICLTWRRTQPYENLRPDLGPFLSQNLMQLARRCFFLENQQQDESCGMKRYTPMTFLCVLRSAAERLGRGNDTFNKSEIMNRIELDPRFQLFWRTLKKWMWSSKSRPSRRVRLMRASVKFDETGIESYLRTNYPVSMGFPILRLILIPNDVYDKLAMNEPFDVSSCNYAHCIDNFMLEAVCQNGTAHGWFRVWFPLLTKHGLSETHSGIIVDIQTGFPVIQLKRVGDFTTTSFDQPHPIAVFGPFVPEEMRNLSSIDTRPCLSVLDCVETEYQYTIRIGSLPNDLLIKDLSWLTDQQLPCESAHRITLMTENCLGIQPLKIGVPHPFDVETVTIIPVFNSEEIQLILKKAILEPWPSQFTSPPECDFSCLLPLQTDNRGLVSLLNIHLEQQFDSKKPLKDMSALDHVRTLIAGIFELAMKENHLFITIRCMNTRGRLDDVKIIQDIEPNWYIRIHPPILFNGNRNPVLIISAFDRSLALKHIAKGELSEEEVTADVKRIFFDNATGTIPSLLSSSPENSKLLRYILRLSSSQFSPTKWQKENLPLGKNSPWLATFLSPCYSYRKSSIVEILSQNVTPLINPFANQLKNCENNRCAFCNLEKDNKRCARCKAVYYCCAECQRKHWEKHKMVCKISIPGRQRH